MLLPHKRTFFSYRFLGLPLEGLRNMPGNPIAARNSSDFPVFHMEYELFRLSGKIHGTIGKNHIQSSSALLRTALFPL